MPKTYSAHLTAGLHEALFHGPVSIGGRRCLARARGSACFPIDEGGVQCPDERHPDVDLLRLRPTAWWNVGRDGPEPDGPPLRVVRLRFNR